MTEVTVEEREATRAKLIEDFENMLAQDLIDRALLDERGTPDHWVVECKEFFLNFKVDTNLRVHSPSIARGPQHAASFSEENARRVAATVTNGGGDPGVAMTIRQGLDMTITRLRKCIESLKETGQ